QGLARRPGYPGTGRLTAAGLRARDPGGAMVELGPPLLGAPLRGDRWPRTIPVTAVPLLPVAPACRGEAPPLRGVVPRIQLVHHGGRGLWRQPLQRESPRPRPGGSPGELPKPRLGRSALLG